MLIVCAHSGDTEIHKSRVLLSYPLLPNSNCFLIHSPTMSDHYFMLPFSLKYLSVIVHLPILLKYYASYFTDKSHCVWKGNCHDLLP